MYKQPMLQDSKLRYSQEHEKSSSCTCRRMVLNKDVQLSQLLFSITLEEAIKKSEHDGEMRAVKCKQCWRILGVKYDWIMDRKCA